MHLTKNQSIDHYCDWISQKQLDNEWHLFTATVVFKITDAKPSKSRYEQDYNKKFLPKIKRRLESNPRRQKNSIPIDYISCFEYDEKSIYKTYSTRRCPYHIHALIPIKNRNLHRFWNITTNTLDERLAKDLNSIDVVQDVLIEPIPPNELRNWLRYVYKHKNFLN